MALETVTDYSRAGKMPRHEQTGAASFGPEPRVGGMADARAALLLFDEYSRMRAVEVAFDR
jgi:hypothetical protein